MKIKNIIVPLFALSLLTLSLTGCSSKKEAGPTIDGKVTIYLTRHGETEYNVKGLAQGWSDSPLTLDGMAQGQALAKGLKDIDFASVISSPSPRAMNTTSLIMNGRNATIVEDERLKEMNFGSLEANPNSRLWEKGEDYIWENGWVDYGGENFYIVADRAMSALNDIVKDPKNLNKNVLVSTHGMTILSILYEVDPQAADTLAQGLDNCSITILEYENGAYKLVTLNDTSYQEKE